MRQSSFTSAMHWFDTWYPSKWIWWSLSPTSHKGRLDTRKAAQEILVPHFFLGCCIGSPRSGFGSTCTNHKHTVVHCSTQGRIIKVKNAPASMRGHVIPRLANRFWGGGASTTAATDDETYLTAQSGHSFQPRGPNETYRGDWWRY